MFDIVTSSSTIAAHPAAASFVHNALMTVSTAALAALAVGLGWLMRLAGAKLKHDWERTIARRLVSWAEMKFEGSPEKRAAVAEKLHEKFPILSAEEIDHLIEEAVLDVNNATASIVAPSAAPALPGK